MEQEFIISQLSEVWQYYEQEVENKDFNLGQLNGGPESKNQGSIVDKIMSYKMKQEQKEVNDP